MNVAKSVFEKQAQEQFAAYEVELTFTGKLMGGVPKSVDLIEGWLRTKMGITDQQELQREVLKTLAGTLEEPVKEIEDAINSANISEATYQTAVLTAQRIAGTSKTTGFKVNENGLYIEGRQVKAMLKETTNIGYAGERWGKTKKGPKAFLAERVFVFPDEISLGVSEPTGIDTVIGHVSDQNGKRATLGYHEFVWQPKIRFQVGSLDDSIQEIWWPRIWIIAENNGLGALRSQGFGTFKVTGWDRTRAVKKKDAEAQVKAHDDLVALGGKGRNGEVAAA